MLSHYFKSAWRNLEVNKFYSFINISGLACGLATAILLLLWVQHERSFERFHKDHDRIYRITDHYEANGMEMASEDVPAPLSVFARSIPRVESIVRIREAGERVLANADRSKVLDGFSTAYVDTSFLDVFDFELLRGNENQLWDDPKSIVITKSTAEKFFGTDDVLGRILQFETDFFTVAAVLHDFPHNSSIQYDALLPMGFYAHLFTSRGGNGDWKTIDTDLGNYEFKAYVKLQEGTNPGIVAEDLTAQLDKALNGKSEDRFLLQKLTDIHLVGADGNDAPARMVRIFFFLATLVLAIAAINYINLSTARALVRAKEISIRKVIGANKGQLFFQFILETTLLLCFALVIAIGLIILLLPMYNLVSGKELHFSMTDIQIWRVIGFCAFGTLLAASVYPAFLLSAYHPIEAMKGKTASGVGTAILRKILVVFQFSTSMVLIVATLVIGRQLDHVSNMQLGYDKSYVFTVPVPSDVSRHIDAVKNEIASQRGITDVSLAGISDLSNLTSATTDIDWPGKLSTIEISQALIDQDFIPTMKIQLLEGRNFTGTPADSNLYIVNETAVKVMGLTPPYTGQSISFHGREGTIAGVVKDFNFKSLREKISPLLFYHWWNGHTLYVRTTAQDAQQTLSAVETQYKRYSGNVPFSYTFIDKQFEAKYASDQRAGLLFNIFAGIAIFISCLGLLGLSTYTVHQRVKEIGIRKVLGASVGSIVKDLSKGSVLLVLASIFIATPIAWYTMSRWLEDFAYQIRIGPSVFLLAGLVVLLIALLTVAFQSVKAAYMDPIKTLRSE